MNTLTVCHTISMGHRLPSYDGICNSPHGHNVKFEVTVNVPVNRFLDFKEVKQTLRDVLEPMDHAMVLHKNDPLAKLLSQHNFRVVETDEEPTTEHICDVIFDTFNSYYDVRKVTVFETAQYSATRVK